MIDTKTWIQKNWQIIAAAVLVIFNIGYTMSKIEQKPDRSEVTTEINYKIEQYAKDSRENYIEIQKVPGLEEKLDNIDQSLNEIKQRFDNLENKIYVIKK